MALTTWLRKMLPSNGIFTSDGSLTSNFQVPIASIQTSIAKMTFPNILPDPVRIPATVCGHPGNPSEQTTRSSGRGVRGSSFGRRGSLVPGFDSGTLGKLPCCETSGTFRGSGSGCGCGRPAILRDDGMVTGVG